jgi:exonuclease III
VPQNRTGIRREDASQELQDAIDRAHEGDRAALPIIREHLASRPDDYWRMVDYARVVQNGQIKSYTGTGLYVQEVMNQRVERLRNDLEGENPSPLESLLVERIISCYLHVNFAENEYTDSIGGGTRIEVAEYMQKRLDRAHRRYLAAVKALAQVRKMGPAIQINIARKQLNVAGAPVGHSVREPVDESTEGQEVAP